MWNKQCDINNVKLLKHTFNYAHIVYKIINYYKIKISNLLYFYYSVPGMYTMRMLDNNGSNNASGPTGATALSSVQPTGGTTSTATGVTTLPGVADERMDASSDSAVSSMGSERVPSLSDGEWMETGSNSSHTQADSHYTMDYAR